MQDIRSAIAGHLNREFIGMASIETPNGVQAIRIALIPETGDLRQRFDPENIPVKNLHGRLIPLHQLVTVSRVEQQATHFKSLERQDQADFPHTHLHGPRFPALSDLQHPRSLLVPPRKCLNPRHFPLFTAVCSAKS